MSVPFWKRLLRPLVCSRPVNCVLRHARRPLCRLLPASILERLPVVGDVTITLPEGRLLHLRDEDGQDGVMKRVFWRGIRAGFEPEVFALFFQLLKSGHTFLDIGTSIGIYALVAAVGDPERTVVGFEPVPAVFSRLVANRQLNFAWNLQPVQAAVSDHDGNIDLYVPRVALPSTASTLARFHRDRETVSVPAVTVDTYVKEHGIARVDLMKIDTEGTEDRVLRGARLTLARDEPIIICEVLKGRCEAGIERVLGEMDYRYFHVTARGLEPRQRLEGDPDYAFLNYLLATEKSMELIRPFISVGKNAGAPAGRWGGQ